VAESITLTQSFALGGQAPATVRIGACGLTEARLAWLFSVAGDVARLAGADVPGPGDLIVTPEAQAWWVGPGAWFLASAVPPGLPDAAITDQADGWLWLDIDAPVPALNALFARLCDVDLPGLAAPWSARSVIEHHGVWLLCAEPGHIAVLCPRSSARSLFRAITTAARSIHAQGLG